MQARQAHCGPYEFGIHISLAQKADNEKYINTRQRRTVRVICNFVVPQISAIPIRGAAQAGTLQA